MRTQRIGVDSGLIIRQIGAAAGWERDANLRDVLGRKDLLHNGALTADVLNRREREERGPEPPLTLAYPKDDGTFRRTCVLDPYDDLRYSLLASAAAPVVNAALPDATTVLSTRFLPAGPRVFRAEGWREVKRRRGCSVDRSGRLPTGGFDVEDHFETVQRSSLVALLNTCLAPTWLIGRCEELLASFSAWPDAPQGLPTGPMASALFGTLALLPADRLLQRLGVPYERWVDDFVTQPADELHFDFVRDSIDELLGPRQRLNPNKHWFEAANERDPSQFEEGPAADDDDRVASLEALIEAVAAADAKRCRFILGGLRWRKDHVAVSFVASNADVWQLAPKHSGDYLSLFRAELTDEQLAQLVDFCTTAPRTESASGICHAAGVLGRRRVPASCGGSLYEAGERASTGPFRAVTPALYFASSISQEKARHRQQRSIDAASALRDLNCQRGLLAGLRYDTRPNVLDHGLRALARAVPDLRPTIQWVIDG